MGVGGLSCELLESISCVWVVAVKWEWIFALSYVHCAFCSLVRSLWAYTHRTPRVMCGGGFLVFNAHRLKQNHNPGVFRLRDSVLCSCSSISSLISSSSFVLTETYS